MTEIQTTRPYDILGIGISAVDELIYLDRFPAPDCKTPVRATSRQGGGLTATALVSAARQGARTAYCCHIGFDPLSEFVLSSLSGEGIDCSPCYRSPDGVPFHSYILVDQEMQTRTILYEPGRVEPPLETVTPELVSRSRLVMIDSFAPLVGAHALRIAHRLGIPVIADLESELIPGLDEILSLTAHLIVGLSFASRLTGLSTPAEMVHQLSNGRACTAVTAGYQGCWFAQGSGEVQHFPAYPVSVVDTTGCGDVFHGAYAAALARGEDVPRAIRWASAAAAIKATRPGGQAGIPDLQAVNAFLALEGDYGSRVVGSA
jgi:sugar/nucleoside kinase (ribokinase family)